MLPANAAGANGRCGTDGAADGISAGTSRRPSAEIAESRGADPDAPAGRGEATRPSSNAAAGEKSGRVAGAAGATGAFDSAKPDGETVPR
jgi:hypothetical protein